MRHGISLWVCLPLVAVTTSTVWGQVPFREPTPEERAESHRPIGLGDGGGADAEELLRQKLSAARAAPDMQRLMERLREDPELFERIKKLQQSGRGIDTGDPAVKELLERLVQQQGGGGAGSGSGTGNQEQIENLRRLLEGTGKQNTGETEAGGENRTGGTTEQSVPVPEETGPRGSSGGFEPPPTTGGTSTPADDAWSKRMGEWMRGAGERLQQVDSLKDSPAIRRMIEDLSRQSAWKKDNVLGLDPRKLAEGFGERVSRLDGVLSRMRPAGGWPSLRGVRLPSLSRIRTPNLGGWASSLPTPRMGSSGLNSSFGQVFLVVGVALLAVVLVIWYMRRGQDATNDGAGKRAAAGGPRRVPSSIRSREELVQAFDLLALHRLGDPALHWNHRTIADELSGREGSHRAAAEELADLYERARYAPADEPLGEPDFAVARRDVALLLGARSA